jgi:ferrous iron transport protein A
MSAAPADRSPTGLGLAGLKKGATGVVHGVREHLPGDGTMERRLAELGFVLGERFEILAEAWPARDPIVVRIGSTTLALRRREAAAVAVELDAPPRRLADPVTHGA